MWRAGAMHNAAGDDESLTGLELYRSIFHVNQQQTFHGVKKLVVIVVLVPVVLAFDDADAHH